MVSVREKLINTLDDLCSYEVGDRSYRETLEEFADKILAIFPSLDGIVVEKECMHYTDSGYWVQSECKICHGTGTIKRKAEWMVGDVDIKNMVKELSDLMDMGAVSGLESLTTKSGGRLKIK